MSGEVEGSKRAFDIDEMLDRIPDVGLFLRFVELDGGTEGKNPEPLRWFRSELGRRGVFEGSERRL